MKKILLSIYILVISCSVALAQTAAPKPVAQANATNNELQLFGSKINGLEANMMRNNPTMAQINVNDIMKMMQSRISKNIQLMSDAKDDKVKADLSEKIKNQNKLAADFKVLSADINTNQKDLAAKARAFAANY